MPLCYSVMIFTGRNSNAVSGGALHQLQRLQSLYERPARRRPISAYFLSPQKVIGFRKREVFRPDSRVAAYDLRAMLMRESNAHTAERDPCAHEQTDDACQCFGIHTAK